MQKVEALAQERGTEARGPGPDRVWTGRRQEAEGQMELRMMSGNLKKLFLGM